MTTQPSPESENTILDKLDATLTAVRAVVEKGVSEVQTAQKEVQEAAAEVKAAKEAVAAVEPAEPLDLTAIRNGILTKYGVNIQTDDPVFAVVTASAEVSDQIIKRHVATFAAVLERYRRDIEKSANAAAERGEKTATNAVNQGSRYLEDTVIKTLDSATKKAISDFKAEVDEGVKLIVDSVNGTSKASQSAWIGAVVSVGCGLLVLGALLSRLL